MSKELPNRATIHIAIPESADNDDEVAWFFEELAEAVGGLAQEIKGDWEPFMTMHGRACEDSDHCYGPGSNEEARIHDETIDEVIGLLRSTARGYQNKKLGNMTWAEAIVLIKGMKLRPPDSAETDK